MGNGYKNPIIPGFNPDPSICRRDYDFFLAVSSFEFFPGLPIYHSCDLINWELVNYGLKDRRFLDLRDEPCDGGIWAPTIRYNNGVFYLITYNQKIRKHLIITAADPFGSWSEPLYIDQPGIDPSLFFDDDGKVYYQRTDGQAGIVQSLIDIELGRLLDTPGLIWSGTGGRCPEGPHLYKIKGYYYLVLAEGETGVGHMVAVARSRDPWGPFESCPHNPVLSHRDRWGHDIQCLGHGDIVEDLSGNFWMVFLATRPNNAPFLGRETFLVPVDFEDDWPVVSCNGQVELYMDRSPIATQQESSLGFEADFRDGKLPLVFNSLREPIDSFYQIDKDTNTLRLFANNRTLDENASPSWIGFRLTAHQSTTLAEIAFEPKAPDDETGLTLFCNNKYHVDIYVIYKNGKKMIGLRKKIGDAVDERTLLPLESGSRVSLKLVTEQDNCYYWYADGDENFRLLGKSISSYVAWGVVFTGPFIGFYVYSKEYIRQTYTDYLKIKHIA